MADLVSILKEEMSIYAGEGARSYAFPLFDDEHYTYGVILVDFWETHYSPFLIMMARVVDDQIIIDIDTAKRPLVDALLARGIPREKIVLAYDQEPYPPAAILAEVNMA